LCAIAFLIAAASERFSAKREFVYPGIGARMSAPDRLKEIWCQSFHQMDMAPALVARARPAEHTSYTSCATGLTARMRSTRCSTRLSIISTSREI
jgi:hypothetical protein